MYITLPNRKSCSIRAYRGVVALPSLVDEVPEIVAMQPVKLVVQGKWEEEAFAVEVEQTTVVDLLCGRCLQKFSLPLLTRWTESFAWHKDLRKIDLTSPVRDAVLLELPMIAVCEEHCPGLCADCGQRSHACTCDRTNTREDPRWAQLAKWSKN